MLVLFRLYRYKIPVPVPYMTYGIMPLKVQDTGTLILHAQTSDTGIIPVPVHEGTHRDTYGTNLTALGAAFGAALVETWLTCRHIVYYTYCVLYLL